MGADVKGMWSGKQLKGGANGEEEWTGVDEWIGMEVSEKDEVGMWKRMLEGLDRMEEWIRTRVDKYKSGQVMIMLMWMRRENRGRLLKM